MSKNSEKRFLGKYDGHKLFWLNCGVALAILFILVIIFFRVIFGIAKVDGDSMDNTLQDGQIVWYLRTVSDYERGDVVSLRVPSGDYYVKRIIAVGGDVIDIIDNHVYVNDELLDEPYTIGETHPMSPAVRFPFEVPEGTYFVMGDNREGSIDSRTFGAIIEREIRGRLFGDY